MELFQAIGSFKKKIFDSMYVYTSSIYPIFYACFVRVSPLRKELDLVAIISSNYNIESRTLYLDSYVKGADFITVLECIRRSDINHQIEYLFLSSNQFKITFNYDSPRLVKFPPNLEILDLSRNQLSGTEFPWIRLPSTLQHLYLQNNRLEATVNWKLLPKELTDLWIFGNQFKGSIDWNVIPSNLVSLGISNSMVDDSKQNVPDLWVRQKQTDSTKDMALFSKSRESAHYTSDPFLL